MARYVAVQPIYFGNALAFAAGSQVPEDHVERFGYLDAGFVQQVDDDHRGDAPDLVAAQPDNTPPPLTQARFLDEAALRVDRAQRDFAAAQVAGGRPAVVAEDGDEVAVPLAALRSRVAAEMDRAPDVADATKPRTAKAKPGTGDTTTNPVKEG